MEPKGDDIFAELIDDEGIDHKVDNDALHDEESVEDVEVDDLDDVEDVDLEGDDDIDPEDTYVEGVDAE